MVTGSSSRHNRLKGTARLPQPAHASSARQTLRRKSIASKTACQACMKEENHQLWSYRSSKNHNGRHKVIVWFLPPVQILTEEIARRAKEENQLGRSRSLCSQHLSWTAEGLSARQEGIDCIQFDRVSSLRLVPQRATLAVGGGARARSTATASGQAGRSTRSLRVDAMDLL